MKRNLPHTDDYSAAGTSIPFSPGFGDVTDKFGVTFQIYTEMEY